MRKKKKKSKNDIIYLQVLDAEGKLEIICFLWNENSISLWWGKKKSNFSSKGIFVKRAFQNSTVAAALVWDMSGLVVWDFSEMLWGILAAGYSEEAFVQKSPFCFLAWDFTTAELFMKLNYFSYHFWGNTIRGFEKVNPSSFIASCSLLDNPGIILLLISPVEMKLLWMRIGLVEVNIQTETFSTARRDASLQISFEWESCCSCLSARDWTA